MARWDKRRRLLGRWAIVSVVILLAAVGWSIVFRDPGEQEVLPGSAVDGLTSVLTTELSPDASPIRLQDVTTELGVSFRHFPTQRESLLPEDMGSGVAVGDFDADGWPDLFFVNFAGNVLQDAPFDKSRGRARLYRNVKGRRFEDVTQSSGIDFVGYGMGAAWGDYDNDSDLDLYITALGDNVLYQNQGDGTFVDVTARAGVADTRFSAGCSWGDYDRDGHIDLYVCNYVDFVFRESERGAVKVQYATEQPYTLNPSAYEPLPNALFRNMGDGTFQNVAEAAGVNDPSGRSLSASWVDLDNDGWVDLYVANDVSNNGVFRNRGDGTFEDIGPPSLAADYRGAMGIAVSDFDHDLDQDLLVTHWIAQENALFRNMFTDAGVGASTDRRVWFMDDADLSGLGQVSLDRVGWATGFCDFDNDGLPDLWCNNGSTLEDTDNHRLLVPQTPFLFWNRGEAGFVDVAAQASPGLGKRIVGRGGAHWDYNRDGLMDLVLVVHGGDAMVFKNVTSSTGHWLHVQLRQTAFNTFALGARVYLHTGDKTLMAEVGSSSSYLSQDDLSMHFGLGDVTSIETLRIVWPDGVEETHTNLGVDQILSFEHTPRYGDLANHESRDVLLPD